LGPDILNPNPYDTSLLGGGTPLDFSSNSRVLSLGDYFLLLAEEEVPLVELNFGAPRLRGAL